MLKKSSLVKIDTLFAILFFGTIFVALPFWPVCFGSSYSAVIVVHEGQSIAQAVGRASVGDILFVENGIYVESGITVNKSLSIVGESTENTVIDGGSTIQVIFQILADDVTLKNLTLRNTSPDPFIQAPAVRLFGVADAKVQNITIINAAVGVELRSSNLSQVSRCRISGCVSSGLYLRDKSCGNIFVGDSIMNSTNGIRFADTSSEGNRIYHNNFQNDTVQISYFGGTNFFDNRYPSGGNYWDGYVYEDVRKGVNQDQDGSDGILDRGYFLDNYPIANPVTNIDVQEAGTDFYLQCSTNVTIARWSFSVSEKTLTFFVSSQQVVTSSTRVAVPKELLSCETLNGWTISVLDGNPIGVEYLSMEDLENTYFYFTYKNEGEGEIQIVGTKAVPELSLFAALTALITLTSFIVGTTIRRSTAKKPYGTADKSTRSSGFISTVIAAASASLHATVTFAENIP